jgi:hypothetical protein
MARVAVTASLIARNELVAERTEKAHAVFSAAPSHESRRFRQNPLRSFCFPSS